MKVKKLHPNAIIPTKAYPSDAGFDLYYCPHGENVESLTIMGNGICKITTSIAIEFPPNTYGLIADRSSMGAKGAKVMGGVIDNKYRGEIIVVLANINASDCCDSSDQLTLGFMKPTLLDNIVIRPGDKIAQLLILPLIDTTIEETNELGTTERDSKGFGSSGA